MTTPSLHVSRLLNELPLVVLLSDAVRHVGRDGAHLPGPLDVEHLVVKVDVWLDLLQQGPFGGSGQEQGLVDLQPPGPQGLQHTGP